MFPGRLSVCLYVLDVLDTIFCNTLRNKPNYTLGVMAKVVIIVKT